MSLSWIDIATIILFAGSIVYIIFRYSREYKTSEGYFMAGKGLTWPLIGFSVIASNISTEHFIGMSGQGFNKGLVMACYEWLSCIMIVIVALFILPKYLRAGINTIPEYLEYRYNSSVRLLTSSILLVAYIFLSLAGMLHSGVLAVETITGFSSPYLVWIIAFAGCLFIISGGLKAVVLTDVVFTIVMILGGALVLIFSMVEIGGFAAFASQAAPKLHTLLPSDDPDLPWDSILLGGFWIGSLFYFGFNQYILQRAFATTSLSTAQKGMLLAATIKLIIPFIIVVPGIIAFVLYRNELDEADKAYPYLSEKLLPNGLKGIFYCAIFAAVLGSFNSVLNSASTIFSLDIYKRFLNKSIQEDSLVRVAKISVIVMVIICCLWTPYLKNFHGVFLYMKKYGGCFQPAIVIIFLGGWMSKRVPSGAALAALVLNPPLFLFFQNYFPKNSFLNNMGITFVVLSMIVFLITMILPMKRTFDIPEKYKVRFERNLGIFTWSIFMFTLVLTFLIIFL